MNLERYTGEPMDRARNYASMSEPDLKRVAARAVNERDSQELWELTESYLLLNGKAGAKLSKHSARAYKRGVLDCLAAFEGENLLRPSRDAGRLWIRNLESSGSKPSTVRVKLAAARVLYKMLRWAGVTEAIPFEDTKAAQDKVAAWDKRQPYSLEDFKQMLENASIPDRVLILLGAHGGLRVFEAVALNWFEVDMSSRELTVSSGKGGKPRRVKMSRPLTAALSAWRETSSAESLGRVLAINTNTARNRVKALCERASVSYLGFHSLRHLSGVQAYKTTGDLKAVADHLGHANVNTSQIYTKWADETLRDMVDSWD